MTITYGVGFNEGGEYPTYHNKKVSREYSLWHHMLSRCYNTEDKHYNRYGGRGITVFKEWHNFQVFAKWCNEQPHFGEEGFKLDKDLMNPEAKVYHPDNCSFIPNKVNCQFLHVSKSSGLPVGVNKVKRNKKKYTVNCNGKNLGYYSTVYEAFQVYKTYKEVFVKQLAKEEYIKGNINQQVYTTLLNWKVSPYLD